MFDIKNFKGCGTALVTPFKANGQIDEENLLKLVAYQIEEGIDFLVPCGTTGESATLTVSEHLHVIDLVVQAVNGRVPIFAGVGSNDTAHVISMAKEAQKLNADLIVVGSAGRHGMRLLLGSTANAVLHSAECDVLAVRV